MWTKLALRDPAVRNVMFLSMMQGATMLIPLITLPWVLRALQPEAFGAYAFAQALVQYLVIFVDFGFSLAATKRVAELRDDQASLEHYFWTVQAARAILTGLALALAAPLILFVPGLNQIAPILWASLPVLLGGILFPVWLFSGLERLGLVSFATIAARLIAILPIFLFVHTPDDAWVAALIASGSAIVAGLISLWLLVRYGFIRTWVRPSTRDIWNSYKDAWHLFVSGSAVSLYGASNSFVLGVINTHVQVGLFTAADRLRAVAVTPIVPVSSAYFPRLSRMMMQDQDGASRLIRRLLIVLGTGMGVVSISLFAAAPLIVELVMGDAFEEAVPVLRILAGIPFLVGLNTVLGSLTMINLGLKREFSRILLLCGLFNLAMLLALGGPFGAQGAAASLLITEILVTAWTAVYLARRGFFRRMAKA
jgi:O-antigen/teichoic acid export membrane protein